MNTGSSHLIWTSGCLGYVHILLIISRHFGAFPSHCASCSAAFQVVEPHSRTGQARPQVPATDLPGRNWLQACVHVTPPTHIWRLIFTADIWRLIFITFLLPNIWRLIFITFLWAWHLIFIIFLRPDIWRLIFITFILPDIWRLIFIPFLRPDIWRLILVTFLRPDIWQLILVTFQTAPKQGVEPLLFALALDPEAK